MENNCSNSLFKNHKIVGCVVFVFVMIFVIMFLLLDTENSYPTSSQVKLEVQQFPHIDEKPWYRETFVGQLKIDRFTVDYTKNSRKDRWFTISLPLNHLYFEQFINVRNLKLYDSSDNLLCILKNTHHPELITNYSKLVPSLNLFENNDAKAFFIKQNSQSVMVYNNEIEECEIISFDKVYGDIDFQRATPTGNIQYLALTDTPLSISKGNSKIMVNKGNVSNEWLITINNWGELQYSLAPASFANTYLQKINDKSYYSNKPEQQVQYRVRFLDDVPNQLAFTEYKIEKIQKFNVLFIKDEADRQDIEVPSPWHISLKYTNALTMNDIILPREQKRQYQELFVPLPLYAQCKFDIIAQSDDFYSLIWQEGFRLRDYSYSYSPVNIENFGKVRLTLTVKALPRQFFQNLIVQTQISCPKNMSWQTVDYPISTSQPWMVNISTLIDINVHNQQNALSFFGKYRFLDQAGNALMPIIRQHKLAVNTDEAIAQNNIPLADFLHSGKYLKFYGQVAQIQKLILTNNEIETKIFSYQYLPLELY